MIPICANLAECSVGYCILFMFLTISLFVKNNYRIKYYDGGLFNILVTLQKGCEHINITNI